jgi:hypothetical protein
MEQALWEIQSNFSQNWGQKLVNCLRALHNVIYSENNLDDESDEMRIKNKAITNLKPDWLNDRFSNQEE